MDGDNYIKRLSKQRAVDFHEDVQKGLVNELSSPTFDIHKTSVKFGVYEQLLRQLFNQQIVTRCQWEKDIWKIACNLEATY